MLMSQMRLICSVFLTFLALTSASAAATAQVLAEERVKEFIAPSYSLFNVTTRGYVKTVH